MQNILVVDDHSNARKALGNALTEIFPESLLFEAACLSDARALLARQRFCLALIDLSLPDGSGIDLIIEISMTYPETYLVVATIFDDDQHIFDALKAGTKGYLLKDLSHEEMVERIKGILNGQPPLSPSVARRILEYFTTVRRSPSVSIPHHLTERELEVLAWIAKGFSRPEISRKLAISQHTVVDHVKHIYQKLNIKSRAEAALEAK